MLRFVEFDADLHALDMQWQSRDATRPFANRDEDHTASDLVIDVIAMTTVFMLLDAAHSSIDSDYATSHPPPVHRAMRATHTLADAYAQEFGWDWDYVMQLHDEGWTEASRIAAILRMPEGRWRGETTDEMYADLLAEEEQAFMEFSRALDEENETAG